MEPIRSLLSHPLRPSPDYSWVGSCINSFEACLAFTRVTTCRLAKSPYATLYTGGSDGFVISTAAPIASTGWSDPVPGRVSYPAVDQRLFTAHRNRDITTTIVQGAVPEKLAGREACHDVSVLDQTGRIRVGSINFYSPSHARRNYELVTGSRHRAIQPRSKIMDVRDG
jgi:hypothetical protein